jgi:hypothetical protein
MATAIATETLVAIIFTWQGAATVSGVWRGSCRRSIRCAFARAGGTVTLAASKGTQTDVVSGLAISVGAAIALC